MLIPDSVLPLLASFTPSVPNDTWWVVLEEYVQAQPGKTLSAQAKEIAKLSEHEASDDELAEALVDIGCYHWPGSKNGYREWLKELAARIDDHVAKEKRGRKRPPIYAPGSHKPRSSK